MKIKKELKRLLVVQEQIELINQTIAILNQKLDLFKGDLDRFDVDLQKIADLSTENQEKLKQI